MKTLSIISITILLSACSMNTENLGLTDEFWSLRSITCECNPLTLENGEHEWRFDLENNQIIIKNNTDKRPDWLRDSGAYPITIDGDFINFEGGTYKLTIDGNNLTFDSNWLITEEGEVIQSIDAPIYSFEKD